MPQNNTRRTVGLSLLGVFGVAVIIGWLTGWFGRVISTVGDLMTDLVAWVNGPLGAEHALAGAGVLLVPAVILIAIFAITDS